MSSLRAGWFTESFRQLPLVMPDPQTPLWSDNPSPRDLLGFAEIAAPVLDALDREKLDPVAVGVFGDWGSGKTTILDLIESTLGGEGNESVVVVYTRPWEYDPTTDPKATLIGEVLQALHDAASAQNDLSDEIKARFTKLVRRIKWSKAMTLAARSAVGVSLPTIKDLMDVFGTDAEQATDPTLQGFREEFRELLAGMPEVHRVVVLVDDLDRCLPDSVIAALEAIKLFLSVPKMAFVIAADRRLVTHAIAQRYHPDPSAESLAEQYLEKIVQIPLTVPTLSLADTEAYLALMLVENHLDDGTSFDTIVAHCDDRRRSAHQRILEGLDLDALSAPARGQMQLASILAPVLYRRMAGNPRRLKRFLNGYWIRSSIAASRGITLEPSVLAKLMVLEAVFPDQMTVVLRWHSEGKLAAELDAIEGDGQPDASAEAAVALREWAALDPPLAARELGPYLDLAASLRSLAAAGAALRAELREIAEQLAGASDVGRKAAIKRALELSPDDQVALNTHLAEIVRTQPAQQQRVGRSIAELGRANAAAADAAAARLGELDDALVEAGLVAWLITEKDTPEVFASLARRWVESERVAGDTREAAKTRLEQMVSA